MPPDGLDDSAQVEDQPEDHDRGPDDPQLAEKLEPVVVEEVRPGVAETRRLVVIVGRAEGPEAHAGQGEVPDHANAAGPDVETPPPRHGVHDRGLAHPGDDHVQPDSARQSESHPEDENTHDKIDASPGRLEQDQGEETQTDDQARETGSGQREDDAHGHEERRQRENHLGVEAAGGQLAGDERADGLSPPPSPLSVLVSTQADQSSHEREEGHREESREVILVDECPRDPECRVGIAHPDVPRKIAAEAVERLEDAHNGQRYHQADDLPVPPEHVDDDEEDDREHGQSLDGRRRAVRVERQGSGLAVGGVAGKGPAVSLVGGGRNGLEGRRREEGQLAEGQAQKQQQKPPDGTPRQDQTSLNPAMGQPEAQQE